MIDLVIFSSIMRAGKLMLLSGCLLGVMVGCGSRLQTTVMSGSEPPPTSQVAQQEPARTQSEEAVQTLMEEEKIVGIPPSNIPVVEPAHPAIRPSPPAEIFATPRTGITEPVPPGDLETPAIAEPVTPSSPDRATVPNELFPQATPPVSGVPPISFEPEMPSVPTIREETAQTEGPIDNVKTDLNQQTMPAPLPLVEEKPIEPVEQASKPQEPIQMAKVDPASPEIPERRTEKFLKALGDVFFDYDRFTIRKDAILVLKENAQALVGDLSDKNIVIEGHCDERGTESYNMVLGERRASAVKEFLIDLGVQGDRLQVVSYGKEKPFCTDHNDQCLQENRRGHFILR